MSAPMEMPAWIADEEVVLARVLPALRALQDAEGETDRALRSRMAQNHAAWTDAYGQKTDRALLEEALAEDAVRIRAHRDANRSRELPIGSPYFGRLKLEEGRKATDVLLGKVGVTSPGLTIVDWRHAPLSRLFYEYEEDEEFAEEIAGREREGMVRARRRLDIRDGALVEAQRKEQVLRRRPDGSWVPPAELARAEREDHRLPDIVSLITREQFGVISRPESGVVLLRGRAGSGKTTVALHRVAWLHFQEPARFRPDRMLVVMFNKALQTYISRVLPELGVKGVGVETFHGWAGRMVRRAGITAPLQPDAPAAVARLKRHPAVGDWIDAAVARLGARSAAWFAERLPEDLQGAWAATPGEGLGRLAAFRAAMRQDRRVTGLWTRLRPRLLDHTRDLYSLWEDPALCPLPPDALAAVSAAHAHAERLQAQGALDYADLALLLRLGQRKAALDPDLGCPWAGQYAHVVIDEAQDLSTLEIAALVDACDGGRSVTVAGDPAQRILDEAQFEGFEALLQRLGQGQIQVRLDALQVGHRSTRPIMTLALQALGASTDDAAAAARDGEPVTWIVPRLPSEAAADVARLVGAFRAERPQSLVAVLCRTREAADTWARELSAAGLAAVRRAARADFAFDPGVVVSNVHQVKGLEFDGVVLVDPAAYTARDRHLLHVAITRAADRLWVVATRGGGVLKKPM